MVVRVKRKARRTRKQKFPRRLQIARDASFPKESGLLKAIRDEQFLIMSMAEVQSLQANSTDVETTLPILIQFSNAIFSADPNSKHASLTVWKQHLSSPSSIILYVSSAGPSPPSSPSEVVAFLFAHPRTHSPPLRTGETGTLHIWLAGVLPEQRRLGLLQKMMDDMSARVTGRVTICTIPERFPNMWAWLTKRGWEVERDAREGRIMFSKLIGQHMENIWYVPPIVIPSISCAYIICALVNQFPRPIAGHLQQWHQ